MGDSVSDLYQKYAPRWFKVIRWRDLAQRRVANTKRSFILFWAPFALWWFNDLDPYMKALVINRPGTEEERLRLKQQTTKNKYIRNFEIDEYATQSPPIYDTWIRRQNYPQYYGDKYNTYKKYEGDFM